MIYDFSCGVPVGFVLRFLPAFGNAVSVLLVIIGLSALGALLTRRLQFRATDILLGCGFAAAAMTLVATLFSHALIYGAIALGIIIFVALCRLLRTSYFNSPFWLLALFPGLVIVTAINLMGISGWDDFSHWVPNALYIFHYDGIPGPAMPAPHSAWPSYPYGVPFLTYFASHLSGGFLMQGGAMFNFLLLLTFAAMLAQTSLSTHELEEPAIASQISWQTVGLNSLALLLVTLANPSFDASFTMTNEGDTSIMILVGALALLLWQLISVLKQKSAKKILDITIQIALTAIALVLVKQVGVYLLGFLSFSFLVLACKNKVLKEALKNVPLMLAPALAIHLVWQHYVDTQMEGMGFGVRPLELWRFDLIVPILTAMLHEIVKNNGLFAITLLTIISGAISLFRPATPVRNFALMSALVSSGYLVFLFISYIGSSFSEAEIHRAASFYRYSTHIGFLGMTYLWLCVPILWHDFKKQKKHPILTRKFCSFTPAAQKGSVLLLLSLLPLALAIYPHWLIRGTNAETCRYLDLGRKIGHVLPNHTRLAVVDPNSGGFSGYVINFGLALNEAQGGSSAAVTQNIPVSHDATPIELQEHFSKADNVEAILIQHPRIPRAIVNNSPADGIDSTSAPILLLLRDKKFEQTTFN